MFYIIMYFDIYPTTSPNNIHHLSSWKFY